MPTPDQEQHRGPVSLADLQDDFAKISSQGIPKDANRPETQSPDLGQSLDS